MFIRQLQYNIIIIIIKDCNNERCSSNTRRRIVDNAKFRCKNQDQPGNSKRALHFDKYY